MIHYYVDQKNKTIVVISILNTSQDPNIVLAIINCLGLTTNV